MENKKEVILDLFFAKHFKVKDIATTCDVTSAYISKIIKEDTRYTQEKEFRKNNSKEKRKLDQNTYVKNKREKKRIDDNYNLVIIQHNQASKELSDSKKLTNESYRKFNSSAYNYNEKRKRFEFKEELGRASDVPKYVKGKVY